MRRTTLWGALLGAVLGGACGAPQAFLCASDSQCSAGGQCDDPGFCSFPDDTCPSGRRFGEHAGQGLANECVMSVVASTTGAAATTGSGPIPEGTGSGESAPVADDDTSTGSPGTTTGPTEADSTTTTTDTGTSSTTTGVEVPEGIVAWFRFEATLPGGGVVDSSGNALHGTCQQCPTLGAGQVGSGGVFAGVEDVVLPADALLEPETFTVAAWVFVDPDDGTIMHIVSKPNGPLQRNSYELFMLNDSTGGRVARFIVGNDAEFERASVPLVESGWHHFVGTYDGDVPRIFYDGALGDTGDPIEVGYDASLARIGHDLDNLDINNQIVGSIDDVRIYDVVLDEAEIAELAAQR